MHGWFQKLLKSRASVPAHCEKETKVAKKSVSSVSSASASSPSTSTSSSLSSSSSLGTTPSKKTSHPQSALSSLLRWSRKYDVFVCHSSVHSDTEEAMRLVSFLEASPQSLRCFLWQRDTCPGGAMSTELCQAVEESHLRALLITPNFLQDDWCIYMMHQALAEGPMSNRLIPLVQNLSRSEYPQELRFFFYIDLSRNPDRGYTLVNKTVLKYLQDLAIKEKELERNTESSDGPSGESSPKKDNLMPSNDPTETSIPLEVIERRDKGLSDVCEHHQQ